jgi:carbonic anhydrase
MKFATVVNCMDGRVQQPVLEYCQKKFQAEFIDSITEPGPNRLLAEQTNQALLDSIMARLKISVERHGSNCIAVAGHHDCAGNPTPAPEQEAHTIKAVKFLKEKFSGLRIVGLWVDENWQVQELQTGLL